MKTGGTSQGVSKRKSLVCQQLPSHEGVGYVTSCFSEAV